MLLEAKNIYHYRVEFDHGFDTLETTIPVFEMST